MKKFADEEIDKLKKDWEVFHSDPNKGEKLDSVLFSLFYGCISIAIILKLAVLLLVVLK